MNREELYAHAGWQCCTFDGARKQVLLRGLQATFREKLEWLGGSRNAVAAFPSESRFAPESRAAAAVVATSMLSSRSPGRLMKFLLALLAATAFADTGAEKPESHRNPTPI